MSQGKHSILVVEDDTDVADMLSAYFHIQGYQVEAVNEGEAALDACRTSRPDLIILDIRLPDIDGYEVASRLRSNRRMDDIPIIFLTEKRNRADRLQGLELGADDYITKPFDIQELRLRVRNALRRSSHGALTNPVTQLPEGKLVDERLRELSQNENWALLTVKLVNLEHFREAYGFVASDDVVRAVSLMIQNAVRDLGSPNDFIGQLALESFILVASPEAADPIASRLRARLEQSLEYFYPLKDRDNPADRDTRLTVDIRQYDPLSISYRDLYSLKETITL
ncbi:MAG: response regulator [Anaerolineales bacterium]